MIRGNMAVKEMRLPERGAGMGTGARDERFPEWEAGEGRELSPRATEGLARKPEFNGELELRAAQNKTEQRGRSI